MEISHFIFVEGLKAFALIFLVLLAVKIISAMRLGALHSARKPGWVKWALYLLVIVIAIAGAAAIGDDVAAELYYRASSKNADRGEVPLEYLNALRAVQMRPSNLRYWQALDEAKVAAHQFQSTLDDEPVFLRLSAGKLSDTDEIRFGTCHYFLGQYEQAVQSSKQVIKRSPYYPIAYALEALSYTALKQYQAAETAYLTLLGMVPTDADAVTGLARAYYLAGDAPRAIAVLNATRHYSFSPPLRKHFEDLKALYAQ
ncbi:MAG TPA: tetratricopeptide repeat protein [Terriglobia bacterium]|nr:tetratricopeptide repeat protein [Terriglobia bacterium]